MTDAVGTPGLSRRAPAARARAGHTIRTGGEALSAAFVALGRRLRRLAAARGLVAGLFASLAVLTVTAWADLVVELPAGLRAGVLALAGLLLLIWVGRAWYEASRAARPGRMARTLDRLLRSGGQVLSGWELSAGPPALGADDEDPTHAGLRGLASARAAELAGSVPADRVASRRAAVRAGWRLGAALVALVLLAVVAPRLVGTQLIRVCLPWVDQPPYTPYRFLVTPGSATVYYGESLSVRVQCERGKPEELALLVRPEGRSEELLPLFQERDGSWRGELRDLVAPVEYLVRARRGRTRAFTVGIINVPRLERTLFRLTPPAYTGLAPREGPLPEGGLEGLPGTLIQVTAQSNRPLAGATVSVRWEEDGTEPVGLSPAPEDPTTVTGSFELKDEGSFSLELTDVDGLTSREPFAGTLHLLPDRRPAVRLLQPKQQSFATPSTRLPVEVDSLDDYGLARLLLYRSLNDSRDLPLEVTLTGPEEGRPPTRAREAVGLPLGAYGLSPGDELTFFARAEDNDPRGPKGSESELARVTIISEEEFERLQRTRANLNKLLSAYLELERRAERARRRLEELLQALEGAPEERPDEAELSRKMEALRQELAEAARRAQEVADRAPIFDIETALSQSLSEFAEHLDEAGRAVGRAAGAATLAQRTDELREAQKELGGGLEDFEEQVMEPLRHLEKVFPLMVDAARFTQLYLHQQTLARRMASLRGLTEFSPGARMRMGDLAQEQAQLREQLTVLLEQIQAHALVLPDEEPFAGLKEEALAFARAVGESAAEEEMTGSVDAMGRSQPTQAHDHAKRAEEILSQFVERCTAGDGLAGLGSSCLRFQPALLQGLGDTVGQLLRGLGLGVGEMGMMGAGSGYGYGMWGGTDVGLYGPYASDMGGGAGEDADLMPPVRRPPAEEAETEEGLIRTRVGTEGVPGSTADVPLKYREMVRSYFQRVAEETSAGEVSPGSR